MAPDERGHPTASVAVDGRHLRGVGDGATVVSIATDALMVEQVVTVLNPVLDPETFAWIDQFNGPSTRPGWPVSHAGLLHTYGYTLSTAWTRYGWKSDRYIDGTLVTLFGIDVDDLTPWAAAGTVLSNLTEALDALIASDQPRHLIEESGRLVDLSGVSADGTLRTRVYEPASADHCLSTSARSLNRFRPFRLPMAEESEVCDTLDAVSNSVFIQSKGRR